MEWHRTVLSCPYLILMYRLWWMSMQRILLWLPVLEFVPTSNTGQWTTFLEAPVYLLLSPPFSSSSDFSWFSPPRSLIPVFLVYSFLLVSIVLFLRLSLHFFFLPKLISPPFSCSQFLLPSHLPHPLPSSLLLSHPNFHPALYSSSSSSAFSSLSTRPPRPGVSSSSPCPFFLSPLYSSSPSLYSSSPPPPYNSYCLHYLRLYFLQPLLLSRFQPIGPVFPDLWSMTVASHLSSVLFSVFYVYFSLQFLLLHLSSLQTFRSFRFQKWVLHRRK